MFYKVIRNFFKSIPVSGYYTILTVLLVIVIIFGIRFVNSIGDGGVVKEKNKTELSTSGQDSLSSPGMFNSLACGLSFNHPASWERIPTAKLPFGGAPLITAVWRESSQRDARTIFWFTCYNASEYEMEDILGVGFAVNDLNLVQIIEAGGVEWKRTRDFIYTLRNDRYLFLQMNYAKYDFSPENSHEEELKTILQSVGFK